MTLHVGHNAHVGHMTTKVSASGSRGGRLRGAWLLPALAMGWVVSSSSLAEPPSGARLLLVTGVGAIAGFIWQAINRRDLVDRLTHYATAFFLVALTIFGLSWSETFVSPVDAGIAASAVLSGLICSEQFLRATAAIRERRSPAPAGRAASHSQHG